ncbi:uncharacterized protein BP5553_10548 [Venustampulla echinocandica]|uniref:Uncharacterized protein n=1 Tax=Venustampulla echinocandica TaxID=2656787 RepID=A0A370T8W4_9HELO|nr:uncharacterized protein BP5553_10548 [Venustampulla echinocandica]RDL29921.1 hypothetical protein BP5553_10548 [Venustampulla echinocandica]
MFTRWIPSTGQNIILSFEPPDVLLQRLKDTDMGRNLQSPKLHDMVRQAMNVSETLSVAITTLSHSLSAHEKFVSERSLFLQGAFSNNAQGSSRVSKQITRKMNFYQHMLTSLKFRADANNERLRNETTLASNRVAQFDSRTLVQIGQAAQIDGANMKAIAFLTLEFLPPTFISAMLGTTLFNYTPGTEGKLGAWSISEHVGLYWATAVPISAAAVALWLHWHWMFPPGRTGE